MCCVPLQERLSREGKISPSILFRKAILLHAVDGQLVAIAM